jgi:light-regulated signal transduction histidine kinase (bacteriophytochrome)
MVEETGTKITQDALPAVAVDGTRLGQLFQNLIANAIHYRGASSPRIHISAVQKNEEWLFSIKDNGIGIDASFHRRIFEPFKRLHGTELPGSGIGLSVCKKIVERYQGRIWVESSGLGLGSTFFFTLPRLSV